MKISAALLLVLLAIFTLNSCVTNPKYTSLDIDLMPCERGLDAPKFFLAVEFNGNGEYKYPEQLVEIKKRLSNVGYSGEDSHISDLIVFNHGWNKSPESAEVDYQKFICRIHTELVGVIGDEKRRNGLLIVGVFWPSTITNRAEEPYLLKPLSYFKMRSRADRIAEESLSNLYEEIGISIRDRYNDQTNSSDIPLPNVNLVGHSFGGRMVVRALETMSAQNLVEGKNSLIEFFTSAKRISVVLLNAAMPSERFDWIGSAVSKARVEQINSGLAQFARFTVSTESYLFNIHSKHDTPNRVLFRLASIFNSDAAGCAVGACGIPSYPTVCVSESGVLTGGENISNLETEVPAGINVWNADAQKVIFSHSDIYKGRVASLVSNLLYDDQIRESLVGRRSIVNIDRVSAPCDDA